MLYLILGKFHGFALSSEAEMEIVFPCAELAWLGAELTVCTLSPIFPIPSLSFLEKGRQGEKEGEKHP